MLAELCTERDDVEDVEKDMMMATKKEVAAMLLDEVVKSQRSCCYSDCLELAVSSWSVVKPYKVWNE